MIADEIRKTLQDVVTGTLVKGEGDHCTKIRNLLVESFGTSPTIKREFESRAILKEKQAHFLRLHVEKPGCGLLLCPVFYVINL